MNISLGYVYINPSLIESIYLSYKLIKNKEIKTLSIILNLLIGLCISGIDNFAHIGGLIGGVFASMACGVPDKSDVHDKANGCILMLIYLTFIIYLAFFK